MTYKILVINPGGTSTKIGVYADKQNIFEKNVMHTQEELAPFLRIYDQKDYRTDVVYNALKENGILLADIDVIIGRGGLGNRLKAECMQLMMLCLRT